MICSSNIYKITVFNFFMQPLLICVYNDGNVKHVIHIYYFYPFQATFIDIISITLCCLPVTFIKLPLLPFSSNLFSYVYRMTWLVLQIYHSYSFQATLIDNIIFMLSSSFIYKITVFTFFKLPLLIWLYNDITCITHLSRLLFSYNLNRHYYKIYDVFQ